MKKIIISLITIIFALGIAFGMAGCNKINEPIPEQPTEGEANNGNNKNPDKDLITETAPYYTAENPSFSDYNWRYANSDYETFINYLNDSFKQKSDEAFYLWTPGEAGIYGIDSNYNSEGYRYQLIFEALAVYADKNELTGKLSNSKTHQNITIYSTDWEREVLSSQKGNGNKLGIDILIISQAAAKADGNLTVKFGKLNDDYYANVYCEKTCVATCYISGWHKYLTFDWVKDYLSNHLFLWV